MGKSKSQWKLLIEFFYKRTTQPFSNPKYVMYFFFIIVLVGSFGLLYDLLNMDYCRACSLDSEKVKYFTFNMINISLSLVTASIIDLIFISKKNIERDYQQAITSLNINFNQVKGNVRFFGLISLIISFIFWILVNNIIDNNYLKIVVASFSLMFSYWIWWVSNVRNKILSNYFLSNLEDLIGGNVEPNTSFVSSEQTNSPKDKNGKDGLTGDISNFKAK
jgi:hypothetical protein